jgi:hypothetical protein
VADEDREKVPAWLAEAADLSLGQLLALGYQVTALAEQLYARPWSCVLRLPKSAGWVYFKAVVPGFGHEARPNEALAR